jgi:ABC-2 type transport system ATP-binding protein
MRVEVEGLCRRFGAVRALDDVTFALGSGQRVALIGPNGSGKSTLNRVLVGLLAYEGRVALDGASPRDRDAIAGRIAYLPQVAPRLGAPVRELVRAIGRLRGLAIGAVRARAGELGLDLDAIAALPLRGLSGGMRQKLLLALSLAGPSELLVLDEPTASLDPTARQRFFEAFGQLAGDATVLLCSHRLEEVRALVDHVLVLDEGRLVHDGPASRFLAACVAHVVEVRVEGDRAERWLRERDFRTAGPGWWTRTVAAADKNALVSGLVRELDGVLVDLEVRTLESVDLAAARRIGRPAETAADVGTGAGAGTGAATGNGRPDQERHDA